MRPNPDLETTDLRNTADREPRIHEVIVYDGDTSRRVLSSDPRLRAVQVRGVVYEHTHEEAGTWAYRNLNAR